MIRSYGHARLYVPCRGRRALTWGRWVFVPLRGVLAERRLGRRLRRG